MRGATHSFVRRAPVSLMRWPLHSLLPYGAQKCWLELQSETEAEPSDEIPNILNGGFSQGLTLGSQPRSLNPADSQLSI